MVSAGNGGMTARGGTLAFDVDEDAASRIGDVCRLGGRLAVWVDGSGVPASRRGTRSKTEVGIRITRSKNPGEFAKSVTDNRRGATRMRNSAGKWIVRWGGSRVLSVEWRAMDAWKTSERVREQSTESYQRDTRYHVDMPHR